MNRKIGTFLISLLISTTIFAQTTTTPDTTKIQPTAAMPTEADMALNKLLHSWIMKYTIPTNCVTSEVGPQVSDSVYKARLQQLPCIIEMPYNSRVQAFIDLYVQRKRRQMSYMLGMSDYYFPIFEERLNAYGIPLELRNLPIIESALNSTIISRAGAAGLWQFMVATGRMYGLEINSLVDERCDPRKATDAACRFLKDLYAIYGDWHLVIAAYNCGPGNVNKAISRSGGKRDYWEIYPYLPAETRGYVPIFIAANYAMNYYQEHEICPVKVNMPTLVDTVMTTQRIHLMQVAEVLNIPIDEVRALNPQYRKDIIPGNGKEYSLCLPLGMACTFVKQESEVLAYKADSLINNHRAEITIAQHATTSSYGSGKPVYYKVKAGNTLGAIAAKYHVSVNELKKWNGLRSTTIRVGQTLKIYK